MKATIFFILPALVSASPDKRFVLDTLLNLVDATTIKNDLQVIIDALGSDPTEQACEQAGHTYLKGLLDHSVPLLCHSFQELVKHFHIVPATTKAAPAKRYILDNLLNQIDGSTIKNDLQKMIDLIGSDPTEQACEQVGHTILKGLLDHSVPLLCHSFQELVKHFHIVPATTKAAPAKRYILDNLLNQIDGSTIKNDLQKMIDLIGSDPTEQACEQVGHTILKGLLDHSVPLLCHSFQELVKHFHIVPATTTVTPVKRYILDNLLNQIDGSTIKNDLQKMIDLIGSDPTEQACEQVGHTILKGLLDHSVPLLCHSFQELVKHFHIVPATTAATV